MKFSEIDVANKMQQNNNMVMPFVYKLLNKVVLGLTASSVLTLDLTLVLSFKPKTRNE